jgi:hypothetical protein
MAKKYSLKFWLFFWLTSGIFLSGWYFYWNTKNHGVAQTLSSALNLLPIDSEQRKEYQALATLGNYFLEKDGQEKTFLVLFQNNLELRPGGGFIGTFGIIKIRNEKIISLETYDLSNFDTQIPNTIEPPYPMKEIGYATAWKMRDSNFSPDFVSNAQKAQDFYYLGQGQQQFDGIIGITANTLTSMLKATGPIQIEGYPGTYDSENAVIALEYQVEQAFDEQGIARGERKSVINDLAKEIEQRVLTLSASQKIELLKILMQDLKQKDIQLYFKDAEIQKVIENADWAGRVDQNWNKDYLMAIDANLGAFKSDYYIKRSLDYTIDLSGDTPLANLKITYEHTAKQKDWMTRDYLTYLRVYVPSGSWFASGTNFDNPRFGDEFQKKYFGAIVKVPISSTKTVEISYTIPQELTDNYNLEIQKQAGISNEPVLVHIINKNGSQKDYSYNINSDIVVKN